MKDHIIIETNGDDDPFFVKGLTGGFKKNQPSIKIGSSRGTIDQPEICQVGDQIGVLKFTAYTGGKKDVGYNNAAFVSAVVKNIEKGKEEVDADLILGSSKSIFTGEYVTIDSKGILTAKGIRITNDLNAVEERDKTKEWWLSNGCRYDYPVPFVIDTKSTGIQIKQQGNFKQPALRFDSYDNNPYKAGWTAFNRYRGTPDNPLALQDGDFIYAFDWLGKPSSGQDWEWGMAQTAIVDGDPVDGFLPTSMNWVTRDTPHSKPEIRVRISNNGKLIAYKGVSINEKLELNLEEVEPAKVDTSQVRYFKVLLNGVECAMAVHPLK